MTTIFRDFEFDAAHRLLKHEGSCSNIHGHRYKIRVKVGGEQDEMGRVIDFGKLKSVVGMWIDQFWDHGLIVQSDDSDLLEFLAERSLKYYIMPNAPTAENMAKHFFDKIRESLKKHDVELLSVTVWETPSCSAVYAPRAARNT